MVHYKVEDDGLAFSESFQDDPYGYIRSTKKADHSADLPANRYGSVSVTAGVETIVTITGLDTNIPYDVYILAEDGAGNYPPALIKLDAATVLSSDNDILSFTVPNQVMDSIIDTTNHTVEFHMPDGADETALTPAITVSPKASTDPASGTAQDFSTPVIYTVTAEDGTAQEWMVTCIVDPASGTISGTVTLEDGTGVYPSGAVKVAVNVDGFEYWATSAPWDGTYTITGVPAGTGYTVTASRIGWDDMTVTNVTVTAGSTATVDFRAVFSVSTGAIAGVAKDSGHNPISGVTVSLSVGGTVYQSTTDDNGAYTISDVPVGTGYTVTASKAGYVSQTMEYIWVAAGGTTPVDFTLTETSGGGGDFARATPTAPGYTAGIRAANGNETPIPVTVDVGAGTASIYVGSPNLAQGGNVTVTMPSVPGLTQYTIGMPAANLATPNGGTLTFITDRGSLMLRSDMLSDTAGAEAEKAQISIGQGDKSGLPDDIKAAIGNRPIVQLTLTLGGTQTEWSNPSAPVTVTIPHTPTPEELANPDGITVWYIDGSGNAVAVSSGRYDPETGTVTFAVTHFSHYAVVYVEKTFEDLEGALWAKKPIEALAAKGIIKGMTDDEFWPQSKITRADFLTLLVRTLGLSAREIGQFDDVSPSDYFYDHVGIAKTLGISNGVDGNRFEPRAPITRQDMMALTARALACVGKLALVGSAVDLAGFTDSEMVSSYAVESIASLVLRGLITGADGRINPLGNTARAEAAVLLYRVYRGA